MGPPAGYHERRLAPDRETGRLSRLAPLDKALLLILVPLWLVCFGLAVRSQVEGGGFIVLGVSLADSASYPMLTGHYYRLHSSNPLELAGLRAGDRLMRLGDADLRGVGGFGFFLHAIREAGRDPDATLVYERAGEERETRLPLFSMSETRPRVAASLGFAAVLFLLLRARPTPTVRASFHLGIVYAIALCPSPTFVWIVTSVVVIGLGFPLQLRFCLLFPDDVAPGGRWSRVWPWLFAVIGPFWAVTLTGRVALGQAGMHGLAGLAHVASLALLTLKYWRGSDLARRQIRWVVLGAYLGMLPPAIAYALAMLDPAFGPLILHAGWSGILFPAFLLASVVRFNLFDVDRILSATASLNLLVVALGAGALIGVPRIAEPASNLIGADPGTGQIVLSLALAALVVPAYRRLRPQIDRVFFKERYAVDHGIAELLPTL
ncbi:MAG: hypothetical protein QNK03_23460, partial [Myxococcota bacterium]|nr:hypothetical protein [Myxococcota bacterium]